MRFNLGGKMLLALSVTATAAMMAQADTVNGGSWTTWNSSQLYGASTSANYQAYYWNNFSADGNSNAAQNQANIGWTLTTGGTYNNGNLTPLSSPPGALPFLGTGTAVGSLPATDGNGGPLGNQQAANTDAPSNISLTSSSGIMEAKLEDSITGIKGGSPGILYFGYYTMNGGTPMLTQLFSSSMAVGTTAPVVVTSGSTYGFYIQDVQGQGTAAQTTFTFYMNSAMNSNTGTEGVSNDQHLAVFDGGTDNYWIGAFGQPECSAGSGVTPENSPCAQGWAFDYNDFVVNLVPAPEPASVGLGLMGGGLILFSMLLRRRSLAK